MGPVELQVLLDLLVQLVVLAREENQAPEVPWVHLVQLEREASQDHKDLGEIKGTLVITERGVRKVTEVSLVYKDFLDHRAQLEIREHLELLDQMVKEDLLGQWVHLEKKATWDSLDQWDLQELVG